MASLNMPAIRFKRFLISCDVQDNLMVNVLKKVLALPVSSTQHNASITSRYIMDYRFMSAKLEPLPKVYN